MPPRWRRSLEAPALREADDASLALSGECRTSRRATAVVPLREEVEHVDRPVQCSLELAGERHAGDVGAIDRDPALGRVDLSLIHI